MPDLEAPTDMEAARTGFWQRFELLLSGTARRATTKKMPSVPISSTAGGLEPRFVMALIRDLSIPVPMELQHDGRAKTDLDGWIADLKEFNNQHPWHTTFDAELRQWLASKEGRDIVLTPKKRG